MADYLKFSRDLNLSSRMSRWGTVESDLSAAMPGALGAVVTRWGTLEPDYTATMPGVSNWLADVLTRWGTVETDYTAKQYSFPVK